MNDFYALLNVPHTASAEEIQAAYVRERARQIAEIGGAEIIDEVLSLLDEAYAVLANAASRAVYDKHRFSSSFNSAQALARIPTTPFDHISAPSTSLATPVPTVADQQCPHCGAQNPGRATLCERCGRQMTRPCPQCSFPVGLNQTVCSRCQTVIVEYDQRRFAQSLAVEHQVKQERQETSLRQESADQVYKARVRMTIGFWLLVLGICIAVVILVSFISHFLGG